MPKPKSFLRVFTDSGPLVALAVAIALLIGIAGPASAQFFNFNNFNFGGPPRPAPQPRSGGGGWFGGDFFGPSQQQAPQAPQPYGGGWNGGGGFFNNEPPRPAPQIDYSYAPRPEKNDNVPERFVLVLGDSMADWLAYGLEDAFREQPDMGVTRKHKTVSGLIKYQPKGEPSDWVAAAKQIVPAEKADVIVVMLGLNDRTQLREVAPDPKAIADKKKADAAAKPDAKKVAHHVDNDLVGEAKGNSLVDRPSLKPVPESV